MLGERDKAIDMLERFARKGGRNLGWIRQDPDFDSLRDDPRFACEQCVDIFLGEGNPSL